MKTKTKLILRAGLALLAASISATWCLMAASNAQPIVDPAKRAATHTPAVTPFVDIASAGPLTHVWLGNELSCQAQHVADGTTHEFYPPGTIPGDCGTFIAMGGTLYAPDFTNHGGTATGNLGTYVVFTPISQTPVTGTGTAADPFRVVTVADVAATGLRIQQTDSYIIGDESYRTDIMITNSGTAASGILFRAADAYLQGSDTGYGFTEVNGNRNAVGCSANPNNTPPGRIEEWAPVTGDNNFYEAFYGEIWHWIGTKVAFPNMCGCTTFQDNGAGISWNFSIPANGTVTYSHFTTFSPAGVSATPTPAPSPTPTPTPTATAAPQEAYVTVSKSSVKKGQQAAFIVALDPGPAAQPVTVNYSMSGSASLGSDYTLSGTPGQVTIPAGQSSARVILRARKKVNKAATMTLTNGPGYILSGLADDVATVRIKKK
jgi:hypothetical protein